MGAITTLAEFEAALASVDWMSVTGNFSRTLWSIDKITPWALGSAYSSNKSLLFTTLSTSYAGTVFYEPILQGSLHYTLQEVLVTLAAGCAVTSATGRGGLWKREEIVQEFAWPDAKRDVTHVGA